MVAPTLPIRTERLLLRAYREDDLIPTLAYYSRPDVARYLPFDAWTEEEGRTQLAKRIARTDINPNGTGIALVVEHDGQVIGDLSCWAIDDTLRRAEIGWAFHPDAGGQGFATEAVRATLDVAFGHYRLHRVAAELDPRNTASARLCERVGMTKEGHLRQSWWQSSGGKQGSGGKQSSGGDSGEWADVAIYGLLASEWADRRRSPAGPA